MPCALIQVSCPVTEDKKKSLPGMVARILSEQIGKPLGYCMAVLTVADGGSMGGTDDPVAFVLVRSIGGLSGPKNAAISSAICGLLHRELLIAPDRVYLNFENVSGSAWGHDGGTF